MIVHLFILGMSFILYGSLLTTLKGDKDSKYTLDINYDSFIIHMTKFF